MTHFDILASSLVLVGCLAKRKGTINLRADKNIRYKTIFTNLVTASTKEDRKTGKWCRNHVCLRDKVAACDLSVCDFDACKKVADSCDKIAGVTSV